MKDELKRALRDINEPLGGSRADLAKRVYKTWLEHNRTLYDLLYFLPKSVLSDVCYDFSLDHRGNKETSVKRIVKEIERNNSGKNSQIESKDFPEEITRASKDKSSSTNQDEYKTETYFHFLNTVQSKPGRLAIVGFIGTVIFFLANPWYSLLVSENFEQTEKCVTGEHGNIYKNCELGFQISKPNQRWNFDSDLTNVKTVRSGTPPDEYFLGGVYVSTTDQDHVLVAVYDTEKLKIQSLEKWLDNLEEIAVNLYGSTTIKKEISLDGNWAFYSAEFNDSDGKGYGEQTIETTENRIYFVQSMSLHPDLMNEQQQNELSYVRDSFLKFP